MNCCTVDKALDSLTDATKFCCVDGDWRENEAQETEAFATLRAEIERLRQERDEAEEELQRLAADHYFARAETAEARIHKLENELNEMKDDRDSWIEQCGESREWELYHADRVKVLENVIKMIEMKPYRAEEIIGALIPKIK